MNETQSIDDIAAQLEHDLTAADNQDDSSKVPPADNDNVDQRAESDFMLPAPAIPLAFSLEVLDAMGTDVFTKDALAAGGIFDVLQLQPVIVEN